MAVNHRRMLCPPEAVFAVLADGWLYGTWVPGASRMRDVSPDWPRPDTRLHHSFGVWPAVIDDTTSSVEWDPPRRAVFRARGWPLLGEALVTIEAKRRSSGCVVRITEDAAEGPARLVPRPIRSVGIRLRNVETLRRLAWLAENRARPIGE